jgi:hypothetical protein
MLQGYAENRAVQEFKGQLGRQLEEGGASGDNVVEVIELQQQK